MLWVNWIPEILVTTLLLVSLLFLSIKRVGSPYALILGSLLSLISLVFMWAREDAYGVPSPYVVFTFDSFSWFGRSAGLLWLTVSSVYLAFHAGISLKTKFRIGTLFLFFIAFFDSLFMAKPILMFLIAWLGGVFALNLMVVSESEENGLRSAFSRQSAIYVFLVMLFGTLFNFFPESKELGLLVGCLISVIFPLNQIQIRNFLVRAPLTQSWWCLWTYFCGGVFWVRYGLPLFNGNLEVPGAIFCVTAITSALVSVRTNNALVWLGAALSAATSMAWLSLLVDSTNTFNQFYLFGLVFIFVFTFAGYSFHLLAPRLKNSKMLVSLSLVSFFFPLIEELITKGFLVFAVLAVGVWFMLSVSVIQQLGKLITMKKGQEIDSPAHRVLFSIFLCSVIALTVLKHPLLQLLNRHSN